MVHPLRQVHPGCFHLALDVARPGAASVEVYRTRGVRDGTAARGQLRENSAAGTGLKFLEIGWWSISYTKLDDMSGCRATAPFDQETVLEMALFHSKGG